jgi:hypothetical protein
MATIKAFKRRIGMDKQKFDEIFTECATTLMKESCDNLLKSIETLVNQES